MRPELFELQDRFNRRTFLKRTGGVGLAALAAIIGDDAFAFGTSPEDETRIGGLPGVPHFAPKAKRVIYLFQSGAPSQLELFDYKPKLAEHRGEDLPSSVRMGQRLTGMTSGQAKFPVAPSVFKFSQHGQGGAWFSELLPHLAERADDICVVRSLFTEAINHDPAVTFLQTGFQLAGRPAMGAWLSYGLGTMNRDLPSFVVLTSIGSGRKDDQPLDDRLWGSGFLPTAHQGVKFRNTGDPVLFLTDPHGIDRETRREMLDDVMGLNQERKAVMGDPEIDTRIAQYELAFRMQTSVPDLLDIKKEPAAVLEMYGPAVTRPGSFAYNCLLARRLAERGVRFVQLYHMGWDQHFNLPNAIRLQAEDIDRPSAALIQDLKQRGMFDETLIVWGGEFGRTVYSQGELKETDYGRDHHPRNFCVWLAGGGIKGGVSYGETDDFS